LNEIELQDALRRIQFNKTEAETLIRLVQDAASKGQKVQLENQRISRICSSILEKMIDESLILKSDSLAERKSEEIAVGIDGSFFPIGGMGGLWYVPMSVARVLFEKGPDSQPKVDVYDSRIEEIQETGDTFDINLESAVRMMLGENKALLDWGARRTKSAVFIDGPIVDPPSYQNRQFVDLRVSSVKTALETCLVLGCVKKNRDRFMRDHLVAKGVIKAEWREIFPSDQHLFLYLFTKMREQGELGPLFTGPVVLSDACTRWRAYEMYRKAGLEVVAMFFQNEPTTEVLRIDLAIECEDANSHIDLKQKSLDAISNVVSWSYPSLGTPLPVQLAHEKCQVRQGCAETLFDEIMSHGKASDRFGQIISILVR
jgi:hypothetical protein